MSSEQIKLRSNISSSLIKNIEHNINMNPRDSYRFFEISKIYGNSCENILTCVVYGNKFDEYNVSLIDGIKISNDESWGLIRASNTSPKITLRFESATEDGLKSIKNDIKNAILKIDNKLDLPF